MKILISLFLSFFLFACSEPAEEPKPFSLADFDWENPVNLSNTGYWDFDPDFSPDGTKIAFHSNRPPSPMNRGQIYIMNADGSNPVALTNTERTNYGAAWSPDGTKIVFASERDGDTEVYVMNADGSDPTNLTNNPEGYDSGAEWSPDGKYLAYFTGMKKPETEEYQPPGSPYRYWNADIFIMNMETGEKFQVTNSDTDDIYPTWSNDGTRLAFTSIRDGNLEIYIINADGTGLRRITNTPSRENAAKWLPGDEYLTYTANIGEGEEPSNNFVVNIETGEITQITPTSEIIYFGFDVSPDNQSMIFSAFTKDEEAFRGERADIYLVMKK